MIVGPRFASSPIAIYRGPTAEVRRGSVSTSELAFVTLRTRNTGRSPTPAVAITTPPSGFTLVGVRKGESFAVTTFRAPAPVTLSAASLRSDYGDGEAELFTEG